MCWVSCFGSILIEGNSYLINNGNQKHATKRFSCMPDEFTHRGTVNADLSSSSLQNNEEENCSCNKKQCLLGIASIAIGLGGFTLALLL